MTLYRERTHEMSAITRSLERHFPGVSRRPTVATDPCVFVRIKANGVDCGNSCNTQGWFVSQESNPDHEFGNVDVELRLSLEVQAGWLVDTNYGYCIESVNASI